MKNVCDHHAKFDLRAFFPMKKFLTSHRHSNYFDVANFERSLKKQPKYGCTPIKWRINIFDLFEFFLIEIVIRCFSES